MEERILVKKKWCGVFFCFLLCFVLAGCRKKDTTSVVPLQEVWTEPVTEETVYAYTLDEEGNLYTLEYTLKVQEEPDGALVEELARLTQEEIMQLTPEELAAFTHKEAECFFLRKYNAKGEREYSKALENRLSSYVKAMAVKEGIVYFAPYTALEGEMCVALYSYCMETEELTMVKKLPYFKSVSRMIRMGDCFYLLGTNVEGISGRDSRKYECSGEKLFCYNCSDDKLIELGIEEPMDVCVAEEGKLCVYAHMGEEFCLLLYDASRDAMKVMAKTKEYKMAKVAFCSERQEVIYQTVDRGLVLSALSNFEVESELYPRGDFYDNSLCYVNGTVACRKMDGGLLRFSLQDVKCENKTLRYITAKTEPSEPFGCGYEMQRLKLEEDKFALKVMALDQDFDLCLVDSADSFSYNLEKNGVFYPLNDVPGMQEYLDACFPYVREAAMDSDGTIWMLPIAVNIPGLLVSGEATEGILVKKDMTYEEYCLAYEALSEKEKREIEKPSAFAEGFVVQSILERGSVDTEEFRNIMQGMAKSNLVQKEATRDNYCRILFENDYRAYFALQYGKDATIHAEPKLTVAGKNVGTCLFLAVNPYSDNLDTTLDYLASLLSYMMKQEEAPLFFQNRVVEDTAYEKSLYALYENGAISFTLEYSIYDGYGEVLEDITKLDAYIAETERKLKIYLNE